MKFIAAPYRFGCKLSSVLMMLALLWLTVSLPVVNEAKTTLKTNISQPVSEDDDSSGNPLAGSSEEKTETGGNTLSEYLHDINLFTHNYVAVIAAGKITADRPYIAFHPEMVCPPPEI